MEARLTRSDLDRLAHCIDRDGFAAHETTATRLAHRARSLRIAPVATDVLLDPTEPSVVRERALLHVTMAMSRRRSSPPQYALAG